jgi:hypothetical protein
MGRSLDELEEEEPCYPRRGGALLPLTRKSLAALALDDKFQEEGFHELLSVFLENAVGLSPDPPRFIFADFLVFIPRCRAC